MHIVTSFHASAVRSDQLIGIMTDYVALERARAHRKFLMIGFGALAFAISAASVGLHWFSSYTVWLGVGLCLVAPLLAWVVEVKCDWRLARRLDEVPEGASRAVPPLHARKS